MEALSNHGNGNYAYVDGQDEARRVLVEQASGTLVTIAKDVKVQVFFNPRRVSGYRLLGYENRRLAARDFNDDAKDAGEIGAGHSVTALYEIVLVGGSLPGAVDPNPFVQPAPEKPRGEADAGALFRLRLRWKAPEGATSTLHEEDAIDSGAGFEQADPAFQWAAAVAGYGMLLRRSPHRGQASWDLVRELAQGAVGEDPDGRRKEFFELVDIAAKLVR
jgi:Ca-activated chloride channel family protein